MASLTCPRCDSENIMPNLRIRDRYDAPIGQDIAVEIESNPNALIFKGAHREALRATVCGECGYVSLSVENPKGLWETYSKSEKS